MLWPIFVYFVVTTKIECCFLDVELPLHISAVLYQSICEYLSNNKDIVKYVPDVLDRIQLAYLVLSDLSGRIPLLLSRPSDSLCIFDLIVKGIALVTKIAAKKCCGKDYLSSAAQEEQVTTAESDCDQQ